jgi:hypothetical protein
MSTSYSITETASFTITHARHIASKVATDLKRFQRFYGAPSDDWIDKYEIELALLLKHNAVDNVVYGFKRDGKWTQASARYRALPGGDLSADDDPGKIRPGLDVEGASFTSFLTYKSGALGPGELEEIETESGFERSTGSAPPLEAGHWADDLTYSAGGRGLGRAVVRR